MRQTHIYGSQVYKPGDQWDECDICGFDFLRSKLMLNWKDQLVCTKCYDPPPRHLERVTNHG